MSATTSGATTPRGTPGGLTPRLSASGGGGGGGSATSTSASAVPVPDEVRVAPLALVRNARALTRSLRRGAKSAETSEKVLPVLSAQAAAVDKCLHLTAAARTAQLTPAMPHAGALGAGAVGRGPPRHPSAAAAGAIPDVASLTGQLGAAVRGVDEVRHELLAVWGRLAQKPASPVEPAAAGATVT